MQLDCWTRKSYGGSFYGEVVNFYNFDAQKLQQLVLAVDEFEHPHTAARLEDRFKKGHQFFGILQEQLTLIWTDNASNMMAAAFIEDETHDELQDDDQVFESFIVSLDEETRGAQRRKHFGDPIHTKNLVSKLACNSKFKTTSSVLESARQLVKTVNGSSKLKQDWLASCNLVLIGDVATRFDSTFLMLERLCTLEVAEKLPRFIEQHPTATTNLLPGTHTWKEMEALKDLLKPFYSVTTLLSGDTWTISLLYPLLRLLLPRVLKKDVNFPRLSAAMAKDLERRFAYLDEEDYFKLATLLVPELSQFALANLCFSGAGVGVERLFSGAAIQAEGRLRVLSNTGLRERSMIASNRDLIEWLDFWLNSLSFCFFVSFVFKFNMLFDSIFPTESFNWNCNWNWKKKTVKTVTVTEMERPGKSEL